MSIYYKLVKVKDFFRYDIIRFFTNLYRFRKELWSYRVYDYSYSLMFLKRTLELLANDIANGYEEEISKNKKIQKIKRAVEIIDNICTTNYLSIAETRLNKKVIFKGFDFKKTDNPDLYELEDKLNQEENNHNREIFELSDKIEEEEWVELWDIISGCKLDYNVFKTDEFKNLSHEEKDAIVDRIKDGSDMRGWWT